MELLLLTVLLAVMQASPPVPRQTANGPANASKRIQKDATNNKTQAAATPAPVEPQSTNHNKEASNGQGKENTEHSIRITELPPVTIPSPKKDWVDWGTWGFNFFLVVTSGFQVWLLCRTLIFIRRQTHEMKRQRVTMHEANRINREALQAVQRPYMTFPFASEPKDVKIIRISDVEGTKRFGDFTSQLKIRGIPQQ